MTPEPIKKEAVEVPQLKNYIYNKIEIFLEDKRNNSNNTYKSYKSHLKQFFHEVYDVTPEFVTMEDLENTTAEDIINYRNKLRSRYGEVGTQKGNSTVNAKIMGIKSFFQFMEASNKDVRSAIFNSFSKLKELPNGYGVLTLPEATEMWEKAVEFKDPKTLRVGGPELSLLFEIATKTCIRLTALLALTWDNIYIEIEQSTRDQFYVIDVLDKQERHKKAINDKLYAKMKKHLSPSGKLFWFDDHFVGRAVKDISEQMGIDPRRNIRFHSFKKCGINFVYQSTGDIMVAQKMGNHRSPATTMKSYMEYNDKISDSPSLYMGEEIDLSPISQLTKEELIAVISKTSISVQSEILRKIKTLQ